MNLSKFYLNKSHFKKGFTLVELLIVMAVIGVLAAIVLVAINPIEQLARGRDTARVQGTGQLGRAMVNYTTAQAGGTYPATAANFQDTLITSKDISSRIPAPAAIVTCGAAANQDSSGYCYSQLSAGSDFVIWVNLESQNSRTKALNSSLATCPAANQPAAVFFASLGKVQLDCLSTAATVPAIADKLSNP